MEMETFDLFNWAPRAHHGNRILHLVLVYRGLHGVGSACSSFVTIGFPLVSPWSHRCPTASKQTRNNYVASISSLQTFDPLPVYSLAEKILLFNHVYCGDRLLMCPITYVDSAGISGPVIIIHSRNWNQVNQVFFYAANYYFHRKTQRKDWVDP